MATEGADPKTSPDAAQPGSRGVAAVAAVAAAAAAPVGTAADPAAAAIEGVARAAAAGGLGLPPHIKFWRDRNREFSTWFLLLPEENRRAVVEEAGPDLPERGPSQGAVMKPSDLLLPELTRAGMLAGGGRCLVLFFTRRAVEKCTETDIAMLQTLHGKKMLPNISAGRLDRFKLAAIDPGTEDVIGVPEGAPAAHLADVEARIAAGALLHAEVYLALKLRQDAIATFLNAVIAIYERDAPTASVAS